MKSFFRFLTVAAFVGLLGAGCAKATVSVQTPEAPTSASDQPSAAAEPVPADSEDVNVMIKAAQQEDQAETAKDKKDNDAQIQEQQKTAIETPASEGVSF